MVLHLREDDLVSGADPRLSDRKGHQVECFARAASPYELVRVPGVHPPGDTGPAVLVGFGRPAREFVNATVNVTQTSAANLSAANGSATVDLGGTTPNFGQAACPLPSF